MDNMQTIYANNSIKLGNDLIRISKQLKNKFPNLNPGMTIYTLISFFGMADDEVETWDVQVNEVNEIKSTLQGLPIFFHQNVLRLFNDRFYKEVVINEHLVNKLDKDEQSIEDSLVESCKDYQHYLKVIPSPFEVIYLYCDLGIDIKDYWKSTKKDEIMKFINSKESQYKIIDNFCNEFEETFSKDLKQGIIND